MNAEQVRHLEQSLLQELADTMGQNAVSLHLTETKAAASASTMGGLSGNGHHSASGPGVHFVIHQVSQSLVEDGPDEDEVLQVFARVGVEHDLVTISLVPAPVDVVGFVLHVEGPEGSGILLELAP